MAITDFNTVYSFNTLSEYRTCITEFCSLLETGGTLVRTNDTGQLESVNDIPELPTTNTYSHYRIYRFNDTFQSTAPYFFRFEFGIRGTWFGNIWDVRITIGTGTNGSGTITNPIWSNIQITLDFTTVTNGIPFRSIACGLNGTISVCWKANSQNWDGGVGHSYFQFSRIRDINGNQTDEGLNFMAIGAPTALRVHRRQASVTFGPSSLFTFVPLGISYSTPLSDGLPRCFRHYTGIPEQRPIVESLTVVNSEIPFGTVFTANILGNKKYISLGSVTRGNSSGFSSERTYALAMIYE